MAQILCKHVDATFVSGRPGFKLNRGHRLRVDCQSGRQATINMRNKLKTARFSDAQADTILEASETAGPEFVKKDEFKLFKFEVRVYFVLLAILGLFGSGENSPVGKFIKSILPTLFS